MAKQNFYELFGITPTTPAAEMRVAIRKRLAGASVQEREALLDAARTLLDPSSRESYDRLIGLRAAYTREEQAAFLKSQLREIEQAELGRADPHPLAELFFILPILVAVLLFALWLLLLRQMLPVLEPYLFFLVHSIGQEPARLLTLLLLTIPSISVAWLLLHLFEHQMRALGRFVTIVLLLGALLLLLLQEIASPLRLESWGFAIVGLLLLLVGTIIVHQISTRDLETMLSPRAGRRKK